MPSHKEEEPVEFKVVDRRKFTVDGELRGDSAPEPEPEPKPAAAAPPSPPISPPQEPPPAQPPPAAEQAPEQQSPASQLAGGVQFEHLIMSLVTQAMLQLGLATRPGDLAPHPDLPAAKETIDVIGILQLKTKGNLTMHEDQLLTGSLSELRMAYLELSRRAAGRIN